MTDTTFKIRIPAEARGISLVDQSMVQWFMSASEEPLNRKDFDASSEPHASTGDPYWDNEDSRWYRPFNVVRQADGTGVLVLDIKGALIAGLSGQFGNYATGYEISPPPSTGPQQTPPSNPSFWR